jgi:CheY-like chemotaxis protein
MSNPDPDTPLDIIVAEDEPITRRRFVEMLEAMNHKVRAFPNGRDAWEAFDREPSRVVISDWLMPEMDGPELCTLVRAREKTAYTYFILVTATQNQEADIEAASLVGTDDFLSKPLTAVSLWRRLRVAKRILGYTQEIGQLRELIPICSYCRQVREDDDYWSNIEHYVQTHTKSRFSHGICPQCYDKVMRDFEREKTAHDRPFFHISGPRPAGDH